MRASVVQQLLGILLTLFSLALLPPIGVSLYYDDGALPAFLAAFAALLVPGVVLWLPVYRRRPELRVRDGFLVVVLFWVGLGLAGALPLALAEHPHLRLVDAVFESISGLTTTGATVLTGLDRLPRSILFYRQQLQWMGGLGIIVLAVAILPMLGVGGMQLYRAETPGPMKDNKLTPRITETAKALWYLYAGLTAACALAYWLAGMTPFDAIAHSFSTLSTGGFSTHDASHGYFDSPLLEGVTTLFMVLAGVNFSLHFLAVRHGTLKPYRFDAEVKTYLGVLAAVTLLATAGLAAEGVYASPLTDLRHALFQTVSVATSTGYTTTGFAAWPGFVPVLLIFVSFVGGCAGSTAGGLKVIRVLLLYKQGMREVKRLIHPSAVIAIKVGDQRVPDRVIDAVWGFFATYLVVFTAIMLGLMATGLDQVTAFSATAASINNLGPGLGEVAAHYGNISDTAKLLLALAMLLGRLEVFTLLVILSPTFWRT